MSGSIRTGVDKAAVNYEAWARSALAFIRSRDLEAEFRDFSGGWSPAIIASEALIAAGPEMLQSLKELTHGLPELLESIGYTDEEDLIGEALAVIAKAEGRS